MPEIIRFAILTSIHDFVLSSVYPLFGVETDAEEAEILDAVDGAWNAVSKWTAQKRVMFFACCFVRAACDYLGHGHTASGAVSAAERLLREKP